MVQYNKVVLHNFGSYNHAEIDLQNKGFCLVTGENHHRKDNALSNGSGKSFIWSGICFAITGQTIQGIKSGLKNRYNDEEDSYVSLDFIVDKDHYFITRVIAPKSDLKIIKNSTDVSGKGIAESKDRLADLLPELTQDFIASTTIIGQGMPNKFSSFKPSGRKELLEKLTKSDFMIEDIKTRIAARLTELTNKLRELEDKALIDRTNLATYSNSLNSAQLKLNSAVKPDFEAEIKNLTEHMNSINKDIEAAKQEVKTCEEAVDKANADLLVKTGEKAGLVQKLNEDYTTATADLKTKKITLETQLRAAEEKARTFKANPDVCPTCGQKLPNADHILKEKEKAENEVKTLTDQLETVKKDLADKDSRNAEYTTQIKATYDTDILNLNKALTTAKNSLNTAKNNLNDLSHYYDLDKDALNKKINSRDNWDREYNDLVKTIDELTKVIAELAKKIKDTELAQASIDEHLQRVKQLETLTKRDFRGFILADIIKYIDTKAKEYSELVFGHQDLNIYLDGNDLDISYSGRMFDNLSGGEKTRVDLIVQFAIRDLLTTYMNASSNILVLDEVTDFLDGKACDAIMNLINTKLKEVESVFIISHHAETLPIIIDSELHIIKDINGISRIE